MVDLVNPDLLAYIEGCNRVDYGLRTLVCSLAIHAVAANIIWDLQPPWGYVGKDHL